MKPATDMVYVAEDPKQPGAAYAICVADGKYPKDTAKTIADWIKRGAIVRHVDRATGMDMITKWLRPGQTALPLEASE